MADEEFPIYLNCEFDWINPVDLIDGSYDRAIYLDSDFIFTVDAVDLTKDCGGQLICELPLNLEVSPTKDISIGGYGDILPYLQLNIKPEKDLYFELTADLNNFSLNVQPTVDKSSQLYTDWLNELELVVDPSSDAYMGTMVADVLEDLQAHVDRLVLSYLSTPPDAILCLMQYQTHPDGEINLDGSILEADVLNVIQFEALGTRLDDYLIEFFVRTSEAAIPSIYKTSNNSPGGIRIVGINPVASDAGVLQQLIAQIVLEPKDTIALLNQLTDSNSKAHTVFYECKMSNRGLGLDYRVAPKRDRGDKGIFTITR